MKGFWKDFKEFINRGNVMDLAVAVVIGAAFTAIVNSVVNDLIMPLISLLTGGIDFTEMKVVIGEGPDAASITYGNFISAVLQFLIIALVVFIIVRVINKAREAADKAAKDAMNKASKTAIHRMLTRNGKQVEVEVEVEMIPPTCPYCLEEVKEGATRCSHCAGVFDEPAAAKPKEEPVEEVAEESEEECEEQESHPAPRHSANAEKGAHAK